jgi:hypothetical protein
MLGRTLGIQPEMNPDRSDFADGDAVPDDARDYAAALIKADIVKTNSTAAIKTTYR